MALRLLPIPSLATTKILSSADFKINDLATFVPLIFVGQFVNSLYQYTGSQDVVQRYQTTKSLKDTIKSLWTTGFLGILTIPLFFGMGTILYTFYQNALLAYQKISTPVRSYLTLSSHNFQLGSQVLLSPGSFCVAQSTIASSLNSISACFVTDFKQRFFNNKFKGMSDVTLARLVIIIAGVISTTITVYFTMGNTSDTWNVFLTVSGLFGVPVAGLFALGIFTKRANARGVLIGFAFKCAFGLLR